MRCVGSFSADIPRSNTRRNRPRSGGEVPAADIEDPNEFVDRPIKVSQVETRDTINAPPEQLGLTVSLLVTGRTDQPEVVRMYINFDPPSKVWDSQIKASTATVREIEPLSVCLDWHPAQPEGLSNDEL
ncbi:MAG: hypothetical protein ACI8V4_003289, partial [Ilumatobacter sp.]